MSGPVHLPSEVDRLPTGAFGRRLARLRARLRHTRLDEALAGGRDPWSAAELAVRAAELCSASGRRALAVSLERLVVSAQSGHRPLVHQVRLRRREILAEREDILALAAHVRAPAPVPVPVLARLSLLLCDGSSPVFAGGAPACGLGPTLSACLAAIEEHDIHEGLPS